MKIYKEQLETKIGMYSGKKFHIGEDVWLIGQQSTKDLFYYTTCIEGHISEIMKQKIQENLLTRIK